MGFSTPAPFDPSTLETLINENYVRSVLNRFELMIQNSLAGQTPYGEGFADEFEDESGVDNAASTGESYDSTNDLYEIASTEASTWADVANGTAGAFFAAVGSSIGLKFTAASNGTVESIKISIDTLDATQNLTAYVYTDNSGSPGTQVGNASNTAAPSGAGDFTLTFATPPSISASTDYWVVITPASDFGAGTLLDKVNNNASYGSGRHSTVTSITDEGAGSWDFKFLITLGGSEITLIGEGFEAETNDPETAIGFFLVDYNSLSPTLNTDVIGYFSIDDGATFQTFTLSDAGLYASDIHLLKSSELTVTAKTDKTIVLKFYTSIAVKLMGWAAQWRYA